MKLRINLTKHLLLLLITAITLFNAKAQTGGAAINSTGATPDNSAMLDVSSTNSGLLIPRMTTSERDLISSPATGLMIFNLDCNTFNYNIGTPSAPNWVTLLNSSGSLMAGVNISANPSGAVCAGANITFTATPSQINLSPTFQWKLNGNDIIGETGNTYSSSTLSNNDIITCELTSSVNCVIGSPAISNALTISVSNAPTITGVISGSVCGAGTVNLSASSSGGNINWYNASTGGVSIWTGQNFTTPSISSTTTFYVDADANGCITPTRTSVDAFVFQSPPAQPSITGQTVNLGGQTSVSYSAAVASATTYSWTAPVGTTITGGQGTASITVDYSCSGSGNITVIASNVCGSSTQDLISVSTSLPTPGTISGNVVVARNTTESYSITPVANAVNYTWTVTNGTITSGQSTSTITVLWGNSSGTETISVVQNSICGTSAPQTLTVDVGYKLFSFTGGQQTFTVPAGITSITIDAYGGQGDGTQGGKGGQAQGTLAVTPGDLLYIHVGSTGVYPNTRWNGGGNGWSPGGDASDVRIGGTALSNRIIVAGGGGGGGYFGSTGSYGAGGGGGGSIGAVGSTNSGGNGGGGGTQSSGGAAGTGGYISGTAGTIGQGGTASNAGGGGGGYYGGGGGGWHTTNYGGGGGGGSNYLAPSLTNTINSQGVRNGNGEIIITW